MVHFHKVIGRANVTGPSRPVLWLTALGKARSRVNIIFQRHWKALGAMGTRGTKLSGGGNHSEGAEDQHLLCPQGGCVNSQYWPEAKDQGPLWLGKRKTRKAFRDLKGLKGVKLPSWEALNTWLFFPTTPLTHLRECRKLTKCLKASGSWRETDCRF